jgi:2-polyprenyl-3-methyl-5-hydroxy-6-metoxy-1,4-benzoquinol methylase
MSYKKSLIQEEYNEASKAEHEYQMVKWGSAEKMLNRFKLAINKLPLNSINTWLDVGSGTGAFQELVHKNHLELKATGIDLSEKLTNIASKKNISERINFINIDFMDFAENQKFDLITCIGVLQKTNFEPIDFFKKCKSLSNQNALIFVDTKNLNWNKFNEVNFLPEQSHEWFNFDDLLADAKAVGLTYVDSGGFIPETGEITSINNSHTMFIILKNND